MGGSSFPVRHPGDRDNRRGVEGLIWGVHSRVWHLCLCEALVKALMEGAGTGHLRAMVLTLLITTILLLCCLTREAPSTQGRAGAADRQLLYDPGRAHFSLIKR